MILVDTKGDKPDKHPGLEMVLTLNRLGAASQQSDLLHGDACFEGNGPDGSILVGIERKTLHDLLNCIMDGRLNEQRKGMRHMYAISFLMVEGHWKAHDPNGALMEGFNGGVSWGYCKHRAHMPYESVYNYLASMALAGMIVTYSRDLFHTCYNIRCLYRYFQKRWDDHTAARELHKVAIPQMNARAPLVLKWAVDLDDIGIKKGDLAARHFRKPITLAQADEQEWLRIPGVGVKTAQQIVREIWGNS